MPCTITAPGHATSLTGVKAALALLHDPWRTPVPAHVDTVDGERLILTLPGGALEARCHDMGRLTALLAVAAAADRPTPRVLFTAHQRQLLVEVEQDAVPPGSSVYVAPASSTGAFAAFNLALPWHEDVPCAERDGGPNAAEAA